MAKRLRKLPPGTRVRVAEGTPMPEFPGIDIGGRTASVLEVRGRGEQLKYTLQWTADALAAMPADFVEMCEARQLRHELVCLPARSVAAVD